MTCTADNILEATTDRPKTVVEPTVVPGSEYKTREQELVRADV